VHLQEPHEVRQLLLHVADEVPYAELARRLLAAAAAAIRASIGCGSRRARHRDIDAHRVAQPGAGERLDRLRLGGGEQAYIADERQSEAQLRRTTLLWYEMQSLSRGQQFERGTDA